MHLIASAGQSNIEKPPGLPLTFGGFRSIGRKATLLKPFELQSFAAMKCHEIEMVRTSTQLAETNQVQAEKLLRIARRRQQFGKRGLFIGRYMILCK